MCNLRKEIKGNLGLFLVCTEITKRNLIALPTSRNTKGIDLVILNDESNKSVGLQIKCSDKKEYPVINSYWHDYEEEVRKKIIFPFVFVDISDINKPRYFILSKKEAVNILIKEIREYVNRYLQRTQNPIDEILAQRKQNKNRKDVWVIKQEWIESYENKWETVLSIIK